MNNTITENLKTILMAKTPMTFADFMQEALYGTYGYYSSSLPKLGIEGDFITAPEMTPLFGYTIAKQCLPILQSVQHPTIFEFGAGSGQLCIDILTFLEKSDALPERYYILEVSSDFKKRQHQKIQQYIPALAPRVEWLSQWPGTPFNGVILANEVLDAMPVHRFLKAGENVFESMISCTDEGKLQEDFIPSNNSELTNYIHRILPNQHAPYASEVNLFIPGWIQACYNMLNQGVQFIIDYGYPRHEYYHPDRDKGTLMCHHRHKSHPNPMSRPGEEDITAHVDFTHVAESACDAGFRVAGYTSQAAFLLSNGILDMIEPGQTEAVKKLLNPEEMGELFKVIALAKGMDIPLQGFALSDKRGSL